MTVEKNIVVGLGEIGKPIFNLISKSSLTLGYDINPELIIKKLILINTVIPFYIFVFHSLQIL